MKSIISLVLLLCASTSFATDARVYGDLKVNGLMFNDDLSNTVIKKPSDFSMPWTISGSNIFYLGGNVGIGGMAGVSNKLDVFGTVNATNYIGDGSTLSNVWRTGGNSFVSSTTAILGTRDTNYNPLEIWVNNQRAIRIEPDTSSFNIISGSSANNITGGIGVTIAGGGSSNTDCWDNTANTSSYLCANVASSDYSTVGGGGENVATGLHSTVGGGYNNRATGTNSTISGGGSNVASGVVSTVNGGGANTASGYGSTVAGGQSNTAGGDYSFAAGKLSIVRDKVMVGSGTTGDQGTFLWSDALNNHFYSITSNEFAARATGGVRFVTAINGTTGFPTRTLSIASNGGVTIPIDDTTPNVNLTSTLTNDYARARFSPIGLSFWDIAAGGTDSRFNIWRVGKGDILSLRPDDTLNLMVMSNAASLSKGGTWVNASDRNSKTGFTDVDAKDILDKIAALPITTWSYKTESSDVRHMGPMAQDFYATFKLGSDDRSIATVDEIGVALAAIKALKAENDALRADLAEIKRVLSNIKQ